MGKSGRSNPRTSSSSTSHSSPSYTSQALALHNGMGGPHPSATQTVQPINVAGEIADMPYRDNPPARSTRGSGSHRLPLPESPHSSGSNSSSGSSGAATPLQYSTPTSSGHAQAQGLHMGMAWAAQPHRTQPKPRLRMDPIRQPEAEGIPDFGRGPREWALCGLCEP